MSVRRTRMPRGDTGAAGAAPSGTVSVAEYAEGTSNVNIVSTNPASPTTVVTASAVTFDGSSVYRFRFFSPQVILPVGAGGGITIFLYDGSTKVSKLYDDFATSEDRYAAVTVEHAYVPAAGSKTFSVRASSDNGDAVISGDSGASGNLPPLAFTIEKVAA